MDDSALANSGTTTGCILCIVEDTVSGKGTDERVKISIVSVQPSTGDVSYDEFEDGFIRSELECRLLHLKPGEVLIEHDVSGTTVETVKFALGNTGSDAGLRIDRFQKQSYEKAIGQANNLMTESTSANEVGAAEGLDLISKLPKNVMYVYH